MNYDNYKQLADRIRRHKLALKLINYFNKIFTAIGFIMYPVLLLKLLLQGSFKELALCIVIPGLSFLAVSYFRKGFNARRPYEIYPIEPLIKRNKTGDSFPSRHTFSIMLIGGLWFIFNPMVGIIILLCGVCLATIRVIGGVHFLNDVVCGTILGLVSAFLVYCFI